MSQFIETLLCTKNFELLVNLFIGLSAMIISLVIFVIDKGNSKDTRNILKTTLLNESKINDLIILTISNYGLIVVQYLIDNIVLIALIRLISMIIIAWIIIKLLHSFIIVIDIVSNDYKKEKFIAKNFNNIIKKHNDLILKENHKNIFNSKELKNRIKLFSCISYLPELYYSIDDNYKTVLSDKNGKIVNINYFYLNKINEKIEQEISLKKLEYTDEKKKKICVLLKDIGDNVEKQESILYFDKNFSDLNFEDIYKSKESYDINKQLINRQITDIFQEYYDNVTKNKLYYIKASSDSLLNLYKTICKSIPDSKQKYYNYLNQLIINDKFRKNDITSSIHSILYSLVFESINMDDIDGYKEFLNYYYWIRTESIDKEKSYFFRQSLLLIKNQIDKVDLDNSAEFYNYTVKIKLKFFKQLLESQLFDEIYNYDHEKELKIFEANSLIFDINNMIKWPKKYEGLNIENEIKSLKKEYDSKINELTLNGFVYLTICEWADYKIKKSQIDNTLGNAFIKNTLNEFEYYSLADVLELYIKICNDKNLTDSTWHWELDEPENFDKCISPTVDILNKVITLMFQAKIDNNTKLSDLKYISMKNLYIFQSISSRVKSYDESNLKYYLNNQLNTKEEIIKYLDDIISKCQKEKNKFISNFKLTEEMNQIFKNSCKSELLKINENSILSFYSSIGKILYNKKKVNNFYGYNQLVQKEFLSEYYSKNISSLATQYSESLKNSQEEKIIKKLISKSKHTEKSIDKIISKFKNINNLIILSPYYINEFYPYSYKSNQYYYPYKNKKIPVYIVSSLFNKILIGKVESFGRLNYYKLKPLKKYDELIDEYTLAYIKDVFKDEKAVSEYIESNKKALNNIQDKEEYLKMRFRLKLYQEVDLVLREDSIIYNKDI